jgi:hypothetical protein
LRIEAVETQLARLPLPGGAWRDAIQDVTHIELVVTDVTTSTGLVGCATRAHSHQLVEQVERVVLEAMPAPASPP